MLSSSTVHTAEIHHIDRLGVTSAESFVPDIHTIQLQVHFSYQKIHYYMEWLSSNEKRTLTGLYKKYYILVQTTRLKQSSYLSKADLIFPFLGFWTVFYRHWYSSENFFSMAFPFLLPVTVVSFGQGNEKTPKEKYEEDPSFFLSVRGTYDYMGFLEIDFLN